MRIWLVHPPFIVYSTKPPIYRPKTPTCMVIEPKCGDELDSVIVVLIVLVINFVFFKTKGAVTPNKKTLAPSVRGSYDCSG